MKLRVIPFWVLLTIAFCISCSSTPYISADWSHEPRVQVLTFKWLKKLGPNGPNFIIPEMVEKHDRFNPLETSAAAFDTFKQRAFVGASIGGLYCVDIKTGNTIWRFEVDHSVGSTPAYDSDRKQVYFGADDGNLYALHARSGRKIWSIDTGSEIKKQIWLKEDTLFFVNADNTVLAVDPKNGEIIWRFRSPPVEGFSASGQADISFYGSNIIAAFGDGTVVALDGATGVEIWNVDLGAEVTASTKEGDLILVDIDATPVVIDNIVVAASINGGIYAMDATNGNVLWVKPDIELVTGMSKANGLLFAACANGNGLHAINPENGKVKWVKKIGRGILQDPVVFDDLLLISDSEMGLFVVSSGTGEIIQLLNQKDGFFSKPSSHAGYMLIMGTWSTLYTFAIN